MGDPERQPVKPFPFAGVVPDVDPVELDDPGVCAPELGVVAVPEVCPGAVWSFVELPAVPGAFVLGPVCAGWVVLGVLFGVEVCGVAAGLLCV
jgi:hypothetical protein